MPIRRADTNKARLTVAADAVLQLSDYPLFIFLTLLGLASILGFLWYWFSRPDWLSYPILFTLSTFILLLKLSINQFRWFLLPIMKQPRPVPPRPGWRVGVATTFVPGAEPLEMLEGTLVALVSLDYPHETWVLDEGESEEVKALCQRHGAHHFSRKNQPRYQTESGAFQVHTKHGNYNAWLDQVGYDRYEIVTAFDPDHVPVSSFLSNVLGYFDDPLVAYVQVAQAYYNQQASFIARGAAEETYAYYSVTQMASYAMGYPVLVGGHTTHRVAALKQMGGFAPHDAEDLLLTLLYRASHWRGVYLPKILARGLTPADWTSYLRQQLRWARSVLDIKFRIYPRLVGRLPLEQRFFSLLHGLNYVEGGVTTPLIIALVVYLLAAGARPSIISSVTVLGLAGLYGVLLLCDRFRQRFYLDRKREGGLHWRVGALQLAKWPYFLLAIRDVLLDHRVPYAVTRKTTSGSWSRMLVWPQVLVLAVTCGAWLLGVALGRSAHPWVHAAGAAVAVSSLALLATAILEPRRSRADSLSLLHPKEVRREARTARFPSP